MAENECEYLKDCPTIQTIPHIFCNDEQTEYWTIEKLRWGTCLAKPEGCPQYRNRKEVESKLGQIRAERNHFERKVLEGGLR